MHPTALLPFTARHSSKLAGILHSAVCTSAIALLLLFAASASAQTTWTVNTTADSNDGSCTSTTCSLRDAIAAANYDSGDTINFSVNGTITLTSALPKIAANVTIQGPGASALTVSGNNAYQVFYINQYVTVTISGLTIANGSASNGSASYYGGGIFDYGTLTVSNCTFSGNSAAIGGGIFNNGNNGTLTVSNSTFSGNSAGGGGGIGNFGTLTVSNSTFSGNSANYDGGGIYFTEGSTLTVNNSTFSGNSATYGGAGIYNDGGTLMAVSNSIFSGNSSTYGGGIYNDGGNISSESNNLFFNNSGGDSSGFNLSSTDVTGQDPMLAPLGNYGGPTQTLPPLPGSAAICAGTASPANTTLPGTDQRGFPMVTSCVDIGSVQTNYLIVNTTADSGSGSLRDAITQANTNGFGDVGFSANGTITLGSALPQIASQVSIIGPGANKLTVSGNNAYQVFYIDYGMTVTISGITIANGKSDIGGGVFNFGSTLTVTNSTFSGNSSTYGGGGIDNEGRLTVTNSTFFGNSTTNNGGGILNPGTLTVSNSTFSGNSAPNGVGGGIWSQGTLTVSNSTFSGNSAFYGGGGIWNYGGVTVSNATVTNSTFSGNSGSSYSGGGGIYNALYTLISETNNLFFNNSDGDSNFGLSSSDLTGQDPMLAAIGNYGGPTQTMLPLPGSAAICAGASSLVPPGITTDQRGFPRTTAYNVSGNSTTCLDIGAVQTNYQSIQFTNATNGYSANVNQDVSPSPNITVTENGQNRDGVPVTLSVSGSPTASGLTATTANGNGATFNSLTVGAPGYYTLSATLNLNPATATPALSITTNPTANLTINEITATVSISNIPTAASYGGSFIPSYSVTPSGDTGTRSVNLLTTGTCTVIGGTVNFVGVGTCTLQAAVAAAGSYQAATGSQQSFSIGQASATVSISNIPALPTFGNSFTPKYSVTPGDTGAATSVTASGACTASGGMVSFVGVGMCTLQASVAATTNYLAGTGSPQIFSIGQASATVSINNIPTSAVIGGSFTPSYTVTSGDNGTPSVTASGACTVIGGTVNFVGVGTCTLQASVAATTDYAAAIGSQQHLNTSYGIVALYSQTASHKSGSTVVLEVQLANSSGKNLSSSKVTVTVTSIAPSPAPGKAPSGNFTFMSGPMYQLNVKTTGYPAGMYTLSFTAAGDPVTHTVGFDIQ